MPPPSIFAGETCFILAGGPSLRGFDFTRLRGRKVIAINSSMTPAMEAGLDEGGVLYFRDTDWFEKRQEGVSRWRGPIITRSPRAVLALPHKVKLIGAEFRPGFPKPGSAVIRRGRSSGHDAVSLAIVLGAATVVLLGYDMREVEGRTHHHDEYRQASPSVYSELFLPSFKGWNEDALKAGVTVLNATPGSALTEFPAADLDEVLRGAEC